MDQILSVEDISAMQSQSDHTNIFLWGTIEGENSLDIVKELLSAETKEINLYINSGGGTISDAISIVNTIKYLKAKGTIVNAYVIGYCFSAATLITAACTGKRYAMPHSRFMFHPISAEFGYLSHLELDTQSQEMKNTWKTIAAIFKEATHGKMTKDVIDKFEKDTYMTPAKAIKLGICDAIFDETITN